MSLQILPPSFSPSPAISVLPHEQVISFPSETRLLVFPPFTDDPWNCEMVNYENVPERSRTCHREAGTTNAQPECSHTSPPCPQHAQPETQDAHPPGHCLSHPSPPEMPHAMPAGTQDYIDLPTWD